MQNQLDFEDQILQETEAIPMRKQDPNDSLLELEKEVYGGQAML